MTKKITVSIEVTYLLGRDYFGQLHGNDDTPEQRREYALDRLISNEVIKLIDPAHEIFYTEEDIIITCDNCSIEIEEPNDETDTMCKPCNRIYNQGFSNGMMHGIKTFQEKLNRISEQQRNS
jgi:hypothetical protein